MTLRQRGLQLIALELAAGLALATGYLFLLRPTAPRPAPVMLVEPKVETPVQVVIPAPEPAPEPVPIRAPRPAVRPAPPPAPDSATLLRRGMDALNARQWNGALEAFDAARRLTPAHPDLGYLRGMALENLGQPGAALDAFRSCTAGPYAGVARAHLKTLVSQLKP